MGWIEDAERRIAALEERIESARQSAQTLEGDVEEAMNGSLAKTQEFTDYVGDVVEDDLPRLMDNIAFRVEEGTSEAGTRLDDFLFELEDVAASGNLWAEQLVGIIASVREGVVSAHDAMNAFGDGLAQFEGEIRPVRDILQDVLPSLGEVQAGIRDMVKQLKEDGATIEELAGRLREQHNTYAQNLARLIERFQQGRATLEAVMQAAQRLQEIMPGTASGGIAEVIQYALRNGDFD